MNVPLKMLANNERIDSRNFDISPSAIRKYVDEGIDLDQVSDLRKLDVHPDEIRKYVERE